MYFCAGETKETSPRKLPVARQQQKNLIKTKTLTLYGFFVG